MNDIILHESTRLSEKYYEINHKSGLRIFVFPKNFSVCYSVFGTKFGSADHSYILNGKEVELPDGSAHFLEHKLFESEGDVSADEIFTSLGADVNAYTTYAATRYMFSATDNYKECLESLLTFVTHPFFTKENVEKEQGIIEQEILMYDDDPYECAMENCLRAMYTQSGVRRSICGSVESISKITPEILYEAYNAFYNLNNMMLSVCGNITPEEVIEIADRVLPEQAPDFNVVRKSFKEDDSVFKARVEKRMNVSSPIFFIGVKDSFLYLDDGYKKIKRSLAMTILNNMLFAGTGELYNEMLREGLITPAFSFGYSIGELCAMNSFSGTSDYPELVLEKIKAKARSSANGDLSEKDFERCKRSSFSAFLKSFDSSAEIADDVMCSLLSSGVDPFDVPQIIESICFDDIKQCAKELFGKDTNWTASFVLPLN